MNETLRKAAPTRKVGWGLFANAMIGLGAWIGESFYGLTIPASVQAQLHTAVVFAVQWFVNDV